MVRYTLVWVALLSGAAAPGLSCQKAFTLQQVLSAPYATGLTASPVGREFAWVESVEGRHNLWVGGPDEAARQLTHYGEDDGQDISGLAWSSNGKLIAFTRGAENGANGKPANPAHLQPEPVVKVMLVKADGSGPPVALAEGRWPLFAKDENGVYFVRSGQIWIRHLSEPMNSAECSSAREDETQRVGEETVSGAKVAKVHKGDCGEQLVFERGTDGQLTLSPDGSQLAFVSRRDHDHSFIGLFDLHSHKLQFVAPSTGNDFAPTFSHDGKSLAWLRGPYTEAPEFATNRVSALPWSVEVADVKTGHAQAVFTAEANKPGSVLPHTATGEPKVWWAADGRIVFYSEADGWTHLYATDVAGSPSRATLLTPGDFEVEDVALSADGRSLAYASNQLPTDSPRFAQYMANGKADVTDTERRHLWRIDLAKATPVPQRVTRGLGVEARPQFSADGKVLAALTSDAQVPMHPSLITADGSIVAMGTIATNGNYPAAMLQAPEQVFFLSSDKAFKLHGQLFLPRARADSSAALRNDNLKKGTAETKHPAILFFHGGPNREMLLGYPSMEYYSNAYAMNQYLASRGFIVLSVNYRCGIGYGMNFRQCEHAGADGGSEYNDALGAAAYLRSRPDVDVQHIGVWGGSYGGYFTALALARNSDIFAAGVDFHGVHDWNKEDNSPDWLRGTFAERDAIAARALASSPMADVDKWKSPVLLIHGDNDPNVAYKQTPLLADALRARGVHVEELVFPDEVHEFLLHSDWLRSYEAEAAFFERTLMPGAHGAPDAHSR